MNLSFLPNALCVLRILLVPPVVVLLLRGEYFLTLGVFAVAAVTDALDGFLAKRFGWTSELGKNLDPLADKILLVTVFITLASIDMVPGWLAALVVARDVLIASGAGVYRWLFGAIDGHPTFISKINTLLQISYVLSVVSTAAVDLPPRVIVLSLGWAAAATTLLSGADYVMTYSRRAVAASRQRRSTTR